MRYKIIAIHVKSYFRVPGETGENIDSVKLENGEVKSVNEVVNSIIAGNTFYYTISTNPQSEAEVKKVWSQKQHFYIRTKANNTNHDNLLHLPQF